MGARAPSLDLLAVRVTLGCVIDYEQQVAARLAPPIGDQRVVLVALLVRVDERVADFSISCHFDARFPRLLCRAERATFFRKLARMRAD
jgi:hypothetical protein